ncbi:capsular biosynthesis protein [Priestia megaterium]|uniref:YveK family protein n=1 Tax=Priestia megaterium TaxID=1404 RepID=UPI001C23C3DC|nr:Wzz/FepE/Etk N-terminal domain-containing protein [Priestia megaterium]MBU8686460.1 capsular biosynthesis protein [Priestia megaterium]
MEETISLKDLFQTVKKRFWLIGLITLMLATATALVSYFVMTPVYSVKTQLLVNQARSDQQLYNNNQVQTDIQLVDTYSVIIKSPKILDEVKKELNLKQTVDELNQQISVSNAPDSQVLEISVEDKSPKEAVQIANTIASVFKKEITNIMNVDNVSILSKAQMKTDMAPVKPRPLLNIAVAILSGIIISTAIAFLMDYLDSTLRREEDIEKYLDLPIMGIVMNMEDVPAPTTRSTRATSQHRVRGESIES